MSRDKEIYLHNLFKKLIMNREKYFYGDYINSDGRRLLEEILKIILEQYPYYRRRVYRVRRDPCIYNIVKLGRDIIGEEVVKWFNKSFYYS